MPEVWTGELIGKMHNARVTRVELAKEMHCTKAYVTMLLNGQKRPKDAQERCESAFEAIMAKRQKGG